MISLSEKCIVTICHNKAMGTPSRRWPYCEEHEMTRQLEWSYCCKLSAVTNDKPCDKWARMGVNNPGVYCARHGGEDYSGGGRGT